MLLYPLLVAPFIVGFYNPRYSDGSVIYLPVDDNNSGTGSEDLNSLSIIELMKAFNSYSVQTIKNETKYTEFEPMLALKAYQAKLAYPICIQPKIDGNRLIYIDNTFISRGKNDIKTGPIYSLSSHVVYNRP